MLPYRFMYFSSAICENSDIESGYQGISGWIIAVVSHGHQSIVSSHCGSPRKYYSSCKLNFVICVVLELRNTD